MFPKGSISFSFDPRQEEVEPTKVGKVAEGCRALDLGPPGPLGQLSPLKGKQRLVRLGRVVGQWVWGHWGYWGYWAH